MQLALPSALFLSLFVLFQETGVSAELCISSSDTLSGLDTDYSIEDPSKLSILGFEASISYISVPGASTPTLKILGASEAPSVFTDDFGILTIATTSCDSEEVVIDDEEVEEEEEEEGSSASFPLAPFGSMLLSSLLPQSFGAVRGLMLAATLVASMAPAVLADEVCKPTLELEITIPTTAFLVSESFGETDHYLAATLDTVTWGYYDPSATIETAAISMESGETITVEIITHHSGHDYAKMIRGDPAIEDIFYWEAGQTLESKPEAKLPGSGVHLVTGPIHVVGAEVGDVIQVDILELDPRYNPVTGRSFGTNSQKFAGYQYRPGFKRDGTPYVRTGGTEAITVFEFLEDEDGAQLYGKPVYMYRFPNMTAPDGSARTFDNNPAVMVPHEFDHGYDGELFDDAPIVYPEGYDDTVVTDEGGIQYLSPDPASLDWKVPLRPHLGVLAVMPNNTANYLDAAATGGASTIPPARFGGNIDDWRIGRGGTMFYNVELPGGLLVVGDTHAAQGDSELAGTAMETSMTTKLRVTLHKAGSLPKKVSSMPFPLLETSTQYVVHGFAFDNYLDELEDASTIFREGASLDLAFEDVFLKTRDWMMDTFDLTEEETIAVMTTSIDFGITQVVDGNWGTHADIPKWVFEEGDTPYDYSCTPAGDAGRRKLTEGSKGRRALRTSERRQLMRDLGLEHAPEPYAAQLYSKVTKNCESCSESMDRHVLGHKFLDAKLHFAKTHKESMEKAQLFLEM